MAKLNIKIEEGVESTTINVTGSHDLDVEHFKKEWSAMFEVEIMQGEVVQNEDNWQLIFECDDPEKISALKAATRRLMFRHSGHGDMNMN